MAIANPLTPYLALIKWGVGVLLLLTAFAWGWNIKGNRDEAKMGGMQQTIDAQLAQLKTLNTTLESVNTQTDENVKAAREARERAEKAAAAAEKAKAKLDKKQAAWDREFEEAKRNPDCKELMERKLCPLIKDF